MNKPEGFLNGLKRLVFSLNISLTDRYYLQYSPQIKAFASLKNSFGLIQSFLSKAVLLYLVIHMSQNTVELI